MQDLPGATNDELVGRGLAKATPTTTTTTIKEPEKEEEEGGRGEKEGGDAEEDLLADQPMKIAWRYQSKPRVQSSFSNQFGHSYDLTSKMPSSRLEAVDKIYFNALEKPAKYD